MCFSSLSLKTHLLTPQFAILSMRHMSLFAMLASQIGVEHPRSRVKRFYNFFVRPLKLAFCVLAQNAQTADFSRKLHIWKDELHL